MINIKKRLKKINNVIGGSDATDNDLIIIIDSEDTKTYLKNNKTGIVKELNDNEINNLYKNGRLSDADTIQVNLID